MDCPNCQAALAERAMFCPSCAAQARCKKCRDGLATPARACMSCGELVATPTHDTLVPIRTADGGRFVNRVVFVETPKRRSLNAELSDTAVGLLGESLGWALAGRLQLQSAVRRDAGELAEPVSPEQLALPEANAPATILDFPARARISDPASKPAPDSQNAGDGVGRLMSELDRSAHPEISEASRVIDRALHLPRAAKEKFGMDGMTARQVVTVLKEKVPATHNAPGGQIGIRQGGRYCRPGTRGRWKLTLSPHGGGRSLSGRSVQPSSYLGLPATPAPPP